MTGAFSVDLLKPSELGDAERVAWQAFRAASPEFDSPYFDIRYTLAAGEVAPHAKVAVLHEGGRPLGFLPFQMRGGNAQPLGAPMTDYHGLIAAPGLKVSPMALLLMLRAGSYRFNALRGDALDSAAFAPGVERHQIVAADLSGGFEAWLAAREAAHPRFFKGKRRNARAVERELGPLRFEWSRFDPALLDYVIRLKRAQYSRTRRHDIFACGWTEGLLRTLMERREADFGLSFAALYAGDTLIGAEVGLIGGPVHHLWLPVYDPAFARFGPGMLMTLESLRASAADGIAKVDFGRADADYKTYFADPAGMVLEGRLLGPGRPLSAMGDRLMAAPPPVLAPALAPVAAWSAKIRRRADVIGACETSALGWAAAAVLALGVIAAGLPTHNNRPPARSGHHASTGVLRT